MNTPIYLDYNATTPLLPEVVEAMLPYLRDHFGNPSSDHPYGRRAARAVEQARQAVANLLGSEPTEVVFTSGGTEASNMAILGGFGRRKGRDEIVSTVFEHPATARPCTILEDRGARVHRLKGYEEGRIRSKDAEGIIGEKTAVVTVMHANNETGVIQPISELGALARKAGAFMHTDAAQSLGKIPVNVVDLRVDLLTVAGHKLYAPKGIGALYIRNGVQLDGVLHGAGHENGRRPGTENVASIVGLGTACRIAASDLNRVAAQVRQRRDELWQRLAASIPGILINGHPTDRLPNTLNVRFPNVSGLAILAAAPQIAASTGSACHAGQESASSVILDLGSSEREALGSVRLSLGRETSQDEVERAANALIQAWRQVVPAAPKARLPTANSTLSG